MASNNKYSISIEGDASDLVSAVNKGASAVDDLDSTVKQAGASGDKLDSIGEGINTSKINSAKGDVAQLGDEIQQTASQSNKLDDIGAKIDLSNMMQATELVGEIGGKLTELGGQAVESAQSLANSQTTIQAQLGVTSDEAGKLSEKAKNIYYDGFGESLDETTKALALTKQNLKGVNDEDLEDVTKGAMALENVFDADMDETLRGASSLMQSFGVEGKDAMDLITAGSQNGLDKTHELGDNLAEYAPLFKQNGFSAQEMFNVLQSGLDAGAYNLDKVNDQVKEFGIRMSDGSIDSAVEDLGDNFKNLWKQIKEGGKSPKEAFGLLTAEIDKMNNEQDKATALSAIFGSQGEDNGLKVTSAMGKAMRQVDGVANAYDNVKGKSEEMVKTSMTPMQEFEGSIRKLKDSLAPLGTEIIETMQPLIEFITELADKFANLPEPVKKFVAVLSVLAGAITAIAPVLGILKMAFSPLGSIIMSIATKALPLLTGAFTALTSGALLPFLPIIAGIVAAVTGAILIFKNWGSITDWVSDKWNAFKAWAGQWWADTKQGFADLWEQVKENASNSWNGIKDTLVGIWNGIKTNVGNFVNQVKTTVSNAWNGIKTTTGNIWNGIKGVISSVWNGIKSVVSSMVNGVKSVVSSAWNSIKSTTSNVWNGIKSVTSSVWNGIKSTVSNVVNGIKNSAVNGWNEVKRVTSSVFNGIKSVASNTWNGIKQAITSPIESAKNTISGIVERIKGLFNFRLRFPSIDIPHIPLPHFSISGSFNPLKGKIPSIGVNWYAKGGLFSSPSIIGVGEAGDEAVLPLKDKVLGRIANGILSNMPTQPEKEVTGGTGTVVNQVTVHWEGDIDNPDRLNELTDAIVEKITDNNNPAFA